MISNFYNTLSLPNCSKVLCFIQEYTSLLCTSQIIFTYAKFKHFHVTTISLMDLFPVCHIVANNFFIIHRMHFYPSQQCTSSVKHQWVYTIIENLFDLIEESKQQIKDLSGILRIQVGFLLHTVRLR